MRLKITALFFIIITSLASCQKEVLGKYYNIEDEKALYYIDFKEDGTFFHYYKKGSAKRSHSGKWIQENNKINILNWEEYSAECLEIISGMGKAEFGTTLGNQIFWIRGSFSNNNKYGEVLMKQMSDFAKRLINSLDYQINKNKKEIINISKKKKSNDNNLNIEPIKDFNDITIEPLENENKRLSEIKKDIEN